jgi:hypothetical protein
MLTHFDKAFISQDHLPNTVVEDDLDNDDRLFDFAAASKDIEAPDHLSDNKDSLCDKSVSLASQPAEEELDNDDDATAVDDNSDFS